MGEASLILYVAPGSSSMAPHIALNEIAAPFEIRLVSFARSETRSPEFLVVNPEGKVPVLLAEGRPLTEVAAILYYLARRHPEAGLMPWGDDLGEAEVVSWMSFIASTLHPARRQGLERAMGVYALAERRLGEKTWAAGGYSIADIHLFRLYWRLETSLNPAPGTFPNLARHYRQMLARPAVQRTLEAEAKVGYNLPV
jgi:glutathione S-transferase